MRDAFGLTVGPAAVQTAGHLPGGGDLLIDAGSGAWLVHANGSRRYLGRYSGASWSPHSRYIIAWHGDQMAALDLTGHRQWALSTSGPITAARWSPDGYRIAFSAGGALRVVAGDGSGEHPLAASTSLIPPAWQPRGDGAHHLTFITQNREIQQINADSGTRLWGARVPGSVQQLLWSPDGRQLLVVTAHALTAYTPTGRRLANFTSPPSATITQATFVSPHQLRSSSKARTAQTASSSYRTPRSLHPAFSTRGSNSSPTSPRLRTTSGCSPQVPQRTSGSSSTSALPRGCSPRAGSPPTFSGPARRTEHPRSLPAGSTDQPDQGARQRAGQSTGDHRPPRGQALRAPLRPVADPVVRAPGTHPACGSWRGRMAGPR